jgi:hypothetical protein
MTILTTTTEDVDTTLAKALVASGGDVKLVLDQVRAQGLMVDEGDVLLAFLKESNKTEVQDGIKSLIMLNFLKILVEAKDHMISGMSEFSPNELIKTISTIVEGLASLRPTTESGPQINLYQKFGADESRDRIAQALQPYKIENAFDEESLS